MEASEKKSQYQSSRRRMAPKGRAEGAGCVFLRKTRRDERDGKDTEGIL